MPTTLKHRDRLSALLQLARPANVVTALADILAGVAASGALAGAQGASTPSLPVAPLPVAAGWLLLSTAGLYAGGVVINDVCDAALDAVERPERPLPSGRISRREAALFGGTLLAMGVAAAALVSVRSMLLAATIAVLAVLYDAWGKQHALLGPLNMGACRGINLLLGLSIVPGMMADRWYLALLPILYIAAITAISRGEVHGGRQRTGVAAVGLIVLVIGSLIALSGWTSFSLWAALPFLLLFGWRVLPAFVKAARTPTPALIRAAVKAGVVSLIIFDATLAAGFAGWLFGLLVLLLLPLSLGLARLFAVT